VSAAADKPAPVGPSPDETTTPSPVRLAVLGLLVEKPSHRYEVVQRFNKRVGATWEIRHAQIYQIVDGLEKARLVERADSDRDRRSQAVFQPTRQGRRTFHDWITSDVADEPGPVRNGLVIRLSFLRPEHLPTLLRVVERR